MITPLITTHEPPRRDPPNSERAPAAKRSPMRFMSAGVSGVNAESTNGAPWPLVTNPTHSCSCVNARVGRYYVRMYFYICVYMVSKYDIQ